MCYDCHVVCCLESVNFSSSSDDESIESSHNNIESKTSVELLQAPASIDEVEVRSSVDEVKRTDSVDSSADDNLRVDDLDELGLSRLFAETKQITWNDVTDLDKKLLQKLQQDCDNLKPLFKIAHPEKQIVNCKRTFTLMTTY